MPTILIVDDEVAIADMLQALLEDEGYHVDTAGNGQAALTCVAARRPDIVVSDVMMPNLDGWQLCQALQTDPSFRSIPIILMSAGRPPQLRVGCAYTAFVPKPFNLDTMLGTIADIVAATSPP